MPKAASKINTKRASATPKTRASANLPASRSRKATVSAPKRTAPRARRAEAEAETPPPAIMLANDAYGLFDIETPFGLIEALGGAEALSKVLPSGGTHIDPVERVLNWARGGCHGFISPGLHLRLLGMAAQVGKTVHPGVFGMSEATIGYDGLIDLARAVDFARHTKRRR